MKSIPWMVLGLFLLLPAANAATSRPAAPVAKAAQKDFLTQYIDTLGFSLGRARRLKWAPHSSLLLFLRSTSPKDNKQSLFVFDAAAHRERLLVDVKGLLGKAKRKLTLAEKRLRERMRLRTRGISFYRFSPPGKKMLISAGGQWFMSDNWQAKGAQWHKVKALKGAFDPRFSPQGDAIAFVKKRDLYVLPLGKKRAFQRAIIRVTKSASKQITNAMAEFIAQEEMGRYRGYWWSPDGKSILVQQTDATGVERMSISDPAKPTKAPHRFAYPRPGKKNVKVSLFLYTLGQKGSKELKWEKQRFPYLVSVRWKQKQRLTILVQDRKQTEMRLYQVATPSLVAKLLLIEQDAAWLNIDRSVPRWLPGGKGFLWSSERRGQWQLEVRKADGSLERVVTQKAQGYRKLLGVDPEGQFAMILGGGEPTERHVIEVPLTAQGKVRKLTKASGWHSGVFDSSMQLWAQLASLATGKRLALVKKRSGLQLGALRSLAAEPATLPHVRWHKVGVRKWNAVTIYPKGFKKGQKYPVILSVYGGPHAQMVTASRRRYLFQQWFADAGAIVVCIDARGTPGRGRAWERATKGRFVSLPMKEQIAALRLLAGKVKEMDLTRVGIFGWSFGGTMAAAGMLQFDSFFSVGVSGAPVTDWRDYDTHYTERYLGMPHDAPMAYLRSSPLTYATQLRKPLLLVHGTADDNVYFSHSLRLAHRIFLSGGNVSFVPIAGATHVVRKAKTKHKLYLRMRSFLIEHLRNK